VVEKWIFFHEPPRKQNSRNPETILKMQKFLERPLMDENRKNEILLAELLKLTAILKYFETEILLSSQRVPIFKYKMQQNILC
jgi:hypothetical protein